MTSSGSNKIPVLEGKGGSVQLCVLRLGLLQVGDVGVCWILRQLPVQRVGFLGADIANYQGGPVWRHSAPFAPLREKPADVPQAHNSLNFPVSHPHAKESGITTGLRAIQNSGAKFSVCKQVSPGAIKAQLNKAFDAMQREHRRYFRYPVSLPLFVATEKDGLTSAKLMNVSAEGLAVSLGKSAKPEGAVTVSFDLPSLEPYRIEARGEVAWADGEGRIGIKLSHMPLQARRRYGEWLDVLHAQLEFRRLS